MTLQLKDILAGERMGRRKIQQNALIEQLPQSIAESYQRSKARLRP